MNLVEKITSINDVVNTWIWTDFGLYLLLIAGVIMTVVTGFTPKSDTINLPIARKEASVIELCSDMERGKNAITHYTRLDSKNDYSLLKIQLETGRTHQIRVHMKAIGHPLPGDFLYNPDYTHIKRQALHSYRLEFFHPVTNEALSFTQNPPEDFFFLPWDI